MVKKNRHFERRKKLGARSLHWSECPRCHMHDELVPAKCSLVLCSHCVCLLVPHPYKHVEEWKAIAFAEQKWEGRRRVPSRR